MVYVGSSDWYKVNAIDIATGELKWDFTTQGDPWSSPAVSNGVVYIGATGGYLYALDGASGTELWKVKTGPALKTVEPVRFDGGVVSSPTVVDGVRLFRQPGRQAVCRQRQLIDILPSLGLQRL